jgi:hypothetical protein
VKLAAVFFLCPLACFGQQPHEQEIQRALIELDRRSAEFARGAPSPPLDPHVGRPLHPDPEIARQLRPYERMKLAEEREANVLRLPPPVVQPAVQKDEKPLPLPGGPRHGVDPVTAPRVSD